MKQSERITLAIAEAGGDLSHQISRDAEPFRIEWLPANGLASPAIPIGCVGIIALFAM
jgi:hypothetical protein